MDRKDGVLLLQAMIDYFEAGNQQSDAAAKDIIESDFNNFEKWQAEIKRRKAEGEWSGLRAPEAEILSSALGTIQKLLGAPSW